MREAHKLLTRLLLLTEASLGLILLGVFLQTYRYRDLLWETGGEQGWNSDPKLRIYFYANYHEPPEVATVWSQGTKDSNVYIAAIQLVVCVIRTMAWRTKTLIPFVETVFDVVLSLLWTASLRAQLSSDLTDHDHLSLRPWYTERSCDVASGDAVQACTLAKIALSLVRLTLAMYASHLLWTIMHVAFRHGRLSTRRRISLCQAVGLAFNVSEDDDEGSLIDLESKA